MTAFGKCDIFVLLSNLKENLLGRNLFLFYFVSHLIANINIRENYYFAIICTRDIKYIPSLKFDKLIA